MTCALSGVVLARPSMPVLAESQDVEKVLGRTRSGWRILSRLIDGGNLFWSNRYEHSSLDK